MPSISHRPEFQNDFKRLYIYIYIIRYTLKNNSVKNTMWNKCCGFLFLFLCCCCCYFIHGSSPPPALHPCFFFPAELQNSSRNDHVPAASAAVWVSVAGPLTWKHTWVQPALYFGAFNLSPFPPRPQSSLLYSIALPTFTPMITSHSLWQSIRCKKNKSFCIYSASIKEHSGLVATNRTFLFT